MAAPDPSEYFELVLVRARMAESRVQDQMRLNSNSIPCEDTVSALSIQGPV